MSILAHLGLAIMVGSQAGAEPMSIDDAVLIAVNNAFAIRTAKIDEEKAEDLVRQAKGAQGLNIDATAGYTRVDQSAPKTSFPGFTTNTESKQLQLRVNQAIDISGISRHALYAARFQLEAAGFAVDSEVNTIKGTVRSKYFDVLQLTSLVAVQAAEVQAAQERLDKANIRLREDALARYDVLRLEADLKRAQQAYYDAERNLKLAKQDLNNTLGRPIDTPFDIVPVTDLPVLDKAPEEYIAVAMNERPELREQGAFVNSLEEIKETEKRGMKPSLNFSATFTQLFDPGFGQSERQSVGTLLLTWPLFDSGVTKARVSAADKDVKKAEINLEQIRLGISLEVRNALTRVASAHQSLEVARSAQAVAEEALRLAQLRFDENVGILLDVITAQAEVTRARGAVINAYYDYLDAYAALQKAVGTDTLEVSPQPTN